MNVTKKVLPPPPEISEAFTLEDIRKIRDYDAEIYKILTWEEQKQYYREASDRVQQLVNEHRARNAARAHTASASA
jgi:hypothetical protein